MKSFDLRADSRRKDADFSGNNAAFTCPNCAQVFIVSGMIHKNGRACPGCGRSSGFVAGGAGSGGIARLQWDTDR